MVKTFENRDDEAHAGKQGRCQFPVPSSQKDRRYALLRFLMFNFVGGLGIGVQLVCLALLKSILHLDYMVATALAVETAVLHNFFWHERFTWADRRTSGVLQSSLRLARFNLTNGAISIAGNLLLMRLFVGILGLNYFAANLMAIGACSLANFMVSDRFVFASESGTRNAV